MVYSAVKEREAGPPRSDRRPAPRHRPARSSRSTTAATCSTGRGRRSGAPRRPTACCATPTSRAATPSCAAPTTGDWQIVDLGSTNGIKVNGRRVASSRLRPGDDVTLGTTTFTFDIEQ